MRGQATLFRLKQELKESKLYKLNVCLRTVSEVHMVDKYGSWGPETGSFLVV